MIPVTPFLLLPEGYFKNTIENTCFPDSGLPEKLMMFFSVVPVIEVIPAKAGIHIVECRN
jgi:hypothetical protein